LKPTLQYIFRPMSRFLRLLILLITGGHPMHPPRRFGSGRAGGFIFQLQRAPQAAAKNMRKSRARLPGDGCQAGDGLARRSAVQSILVDLVVTFSICRHTNRRPSVGSLVGGVIFKSSPSIFGCFAPILPATFSIDALSVVPGSCFFCALLCA